MSRRRKAIGAVSLVLLLLLATPAWAKVFKEGMAGSAIPRIQARLTHYGYYKGKAQRSFDKATTAAVKRFQTANALPVDGCVDEKTMELLQGDKAVSYAQYVENQTKPLKKGDKGEAVKLLQGQLTGLGYYVGAITGAYSNRVVEAVKYFQRGNALQQTGVATREMRTLILDGKALSKADYLANRRKVKIETVVKAAMDQMDKPYKWGSSGPTYFDCTGLTCYAYKQVGISLRRSAHDQGYKNGKRIATVKELKRGDIACFNTVEDGENDLVDHVGIYLGGGKFIHASSGAGYVLVSDLTTGFYKRVFSWGLDVW